MQSDEYAMYNGKMVKKQHFRTFIYNTNGSEKLVNSWEEYADHISTGIWFPDKRANILPDTVKKKSQNKSTISKKSAYQSIDDEHYIK